MKNKAVVLAGDKTVCPAYSGTTPHVSGVVKEGGQNKVFYKGKPLAVTGSPVQCHTPDAINEGSKKFFIGGKAVALDQHKTQHQAVLIASGTTLTIKQ